MFQIADGFLVAPQIDQTDTFVKQDDIIVWHEILQSTEVFERLLIVPQAEQTVGLAGQSVRVVGIDGDGIF